MAKKSKAQIKAYKRAYAKHRNSARSHIGLKRRRTKDGFMWGTLG